jgi:ubiquinone/menaquinone biosynthesis C-methylase UbiE
MDDLPDDQARALKALLRKYYEWEAECGDGTALMYEAGPPLERYEHHQRRRAVLKLLGVSEGERILEIGCGEGHYLAKMAERGCGSLVGLDLSPGKLKMARSRLLPKEFGPIAADAESLPFKDGSFHWVLCTETIEHLLAPGKALKEIRRVLTRDGQAVVSTPTRRGMAGQGRPEAPASLSTLVASHFGRPFEGHLWSFTASSFIRLLARTGLEPVAQLTVAIFDAQGWQRLRAVVKAPRLQLWLQRLIDATLTPLWGAEVFSRYLVCLVRRKR